MKIEEISQLDYAQIRDNFFSELTKASQGEQTSLPYIVTHLPHTQLMKEGMFQALVIGGTHYETNVAKLEADGTINNISPMQKGRLPKFDTEQTFLTTIQGLLDPNVTHISLNLAYPIEPFIREGVLDGRLAYGTKEHIFEGLLGKAIGKTIENYIEQKEERTVKIVTANDTVCLALAGLQDTIDRNVLAGCVIGSGFNISFFSNKNTIVNLESANFNKFPQTPTGKTIDLASQNVGKAVFEKELSGLYLYQHYNLLQKTLNLSGPPLYDSAEVSLLAADETTPEARVAKQLLKRSASLAAVQLAGIYKFKNSLQQPLTCVTEGSVFRKGWQYEQMVQDSLKDLGVPYGAIVFLHIENSSLVGAANLLHAKRI